MMQILPIILVAVVIAADGGFAAAGFSRTGAVISAWAPIMVLLLALGLTVRWCRTRMALGQVPGPVIMAEWAMRSCIVLILGAHAVSVLWCGWLGAVRATIGNPILLDEMIAIAPPVVGILGTWWVYYPIERRLREALIIRRLDDGSPVYPIMSRARYVLAQARLHLLLLLVPILLILGLDETVEWAIQFAPERVQTPVVSGALTLACGIGVFMTAPLLARVVLSLRRLPDGELRRDLAAICRRHGVRVRQFLIWGTGGTMINAAVMGLVGKLRFVMISDALIESMPREQVRAVMAHEVGHVRRHHMLWLVLCLLALLVTWEGIVSGTRWTLAATGIAAEAWPPDGRQPWAEGLWAVFSLVAALWCFGWVSRRFERQADTFAVQHLSGLADNPHDPDQTANEQFDTANDRPGLIGETAANAMIAALLTVSRLNHVHPRRHSWRHGSIAWRIDYLYGLIGRPIDALAIDRHIRWMKRAAGSVLIALLVYTIWVEWPIVVRTALTVFPVQD